jgi:UDP-N-acetylmuramyl pentapeptide synthase
LSKSKFVRKSEKSFTAELGIPLTILGCPYSTDKVYGVLLDILWGIKLLLYKSVYPKWLILEVDDDKPGDLKFAGSLLSVDILVMTAIGEVPAHIESFNEIENLLSEKRWIINAVKKNLSGTEEGVIVYNAEDEQINKLLLLRVYIFLWDLN